MTRCWFRRAAPLAVVLAAGLLVRAAEPPAPAEPPKPDLSEFRTVETAVTTRVSRAAPNAAPAQPAYLGVNLDADDKGQTVVAAVEPDSPAAKAGLQAGDVIRELDGRAVAGVAVVRELLHAKAPGDLVKLVVARKDASVEASAKLTAVSRPLTPGQRAVLGIRLVPGDGDGGARVDVVMPNLPAAEAGLKAGDVILKIDDQAVNSADRIGTVLADKRPGDFVVLTVRRGKAEVGFLAKLAADGSGAGPARWDDRQLSTFRKEVYHLAVVPVEYPDVKHNEKVELKDWDKALFSTGEYTDKSATGQTVYGSLNDYYLEQSSGGFHVEGKVFDWVKVERKRAEYGADSNRFALLNEALDKLEARDGKDALKDFDGVFFLYAGDRVQTQRGGLYWPHRATVNHNGKRRAYFICPEGGERMNDISVCCHEFGHMLGLPDLYAKPENPGAEGIGVWCLMSMQLGNGRPQHMCAWSKEQLGWLKPAVIDPTAKQKLILSPVENSTKECFKVLVKPDGSEYLLLENRSKNGFDHNLPGEGLLIWHVVDDRPLLEESHGIGGPDGPQRFLGSIPYPSKSNNAFTPETTPSSKPVKGGGLPVNITNIRRLPDGRITFFVGYEYL